MKPLLVAVLIAVALLASPFASSAKGYFILGASYRSFSYDPLWDAAQWRQDLKGAVLMGLDAAPGLRLNMASYIGSAGEPPALQVAPWPLVSLVARAGIDYDLVSYSKDGIYIGFGPAAGISYSNVSYGPVTGKADFDIGAQALFSFFSGKLEVETGLSYVLRDVFVAGRVAVRYNPVGPLVLSASLDYLRREGFVTLGVGLKF